MDLPKDKEGIYQDLGKAFPRTFLTLGKVLGRTFQRVRKGLPKVRGRLPLGFFMHFGGLGALIAAVPPGCSRGVRPGGAQLGSI